MNLNLGLPGVSLAKVALATSVPVALVGAIIQRESAGNTWAIRVEPPYRYLWNVAMGKPFRPLTKDERVSETPPADFPAPIGVSAATEWQGQQTSWGLMQVMGAVARECGLTERYLTILCDPSRGVRYGCLYLKRLLSRYSVMEDAVAAYNAGTPRRTITGVYENKPYVDAVMAYYERLHNGTDVLA